MFSEIKVKSKTYGKQDEDCCEGCKCGETTVITVRELVESLGELSRCERRKVLRAAKHYRKYKKLVENEEEEDEGFFPEMNEHKYHTRNIEVQEMENEEDEDTLDFEFEDEEEGK